MLVSYRKIFEKVSLPLEVGDIVLLGKFKNKTAVVTGFSKDDKGQPVIKTNKGDTGLKFRIKKLLPEYTLDQLKSKLSPIIRKTRKIRTSIKGPEATVARFIDIEGDPTEPILLFATEPTFDFSTKVVNQGKAGGSSSDNIYEVRIQLLDLAKWTRKGLLDMSLPEFSEILDVAEVAVDCSCYAFHWTGIRFQLGASNSSIYPTSIADPVWGPRHGSPRPTVCKHLAGILPRVKANKTAIYRGIQQLK